MFLLGVWRFYRCLWGKQSTCCYPREKERTHTSDKIMKAQTVEKHTTSITVLWNKAL